MIQPEMNIFNRTRFLFRHGQDSVRIVTAVDANAVNIFARIASIASNQGIDVYNEQDVKQSYNDFNSASHTPTLTSSHLWEILADSADY